MEGFKRLASNADTVGNNIYGEVIRDFPAGSEGLCKLNKDWGDRDEHPYTGVAADWIRDLYKGDSKVVPHIVEFSNETMVVKAINVSTNRFSAYHKGDIFNMKDLRRSIQRNPNAETCLGVRDINYRYIGLDDFANELLNNYNAAVMLQSAGIKGLVNPVHTYAICGKWSLIMSPLANHRDIYSFGLNARSEHTSTFNLPTSQGTASIVGIRTDIVRDILKQVVIALSVLKQKANFIHADFKPQNVLLHEHDRPHSVNHNGLSVNSKFEIRITDFAMASSTIPANEREMSDIRIFNEYRITRFIPAAAGITDYKLKTEDRVNTFVIDLGKALEQGASDSKTMKQTWWKLGSNFSDIISMITAHSGMVFYNSYDYYTFMVGLMTIPSFYTTIMSTDLYGVWASMWLDSERDSVTLDCYKLHGTHPSIGKIISVLKNYHLSCQAMTVASTLLK